jgi:glutaredoxin
VAQLVRPSRSAGAAALALLLLVPFLAADARGEACSVEELSGLCAPPTDEKPANRPAEPGAAQPVLTSTSSAAASPDASAGSDAPVRMQMFYAHDCPHCHEALQWLPELERAFPKLVIEKHQVKGDEKARKLFEETAARHGAKVQGVPTFFVGGESFVGFYADQTCAALINKVRELSGRATDKDCEKANQLTVPILGTVRTDRISLPQLTVVLGLLDSMNPCAMWVLTFLLSILVHSHSRRKTLMVGGVFVAASGLVYFAFMAAWLNLFLVIGMHKVITVALALIAIAMGLVNLKELFFFKKGFSLMIPESAKPKIAERVRKILRERSTLLALASTMVLAVFANFVELGCTVGFPAIFTKVLAQRETSALARYGYMALYNTIYVVPLALIVGGFAVTLGHFRLSEKHAKVLKLVSGAVMLALGLVMLLKPELLVVS